MNLYEWGKVEGCYGREGCLVAANGGPVAKVAESVCWVQRVQAGVGG